jgi:hypothetical protein
MSGRNAGIFPHFGRIRGACLLQLLERCAMQVVRSFEQEDAALVGFGIRVMLVTGQPDTGPITRRLAGLGGQVELSHELFEGLAAVIDDPAGYGLLVMDCDTIGGLEAGLRAFSMLGETARRLPVILISSDCAKQTFPEERNAPTLLRAPLSAVAARVGFEHALRDRLAVPLH